MIKRVKIARPYLIFFIIIIPAIAIAFIWLSIKSFQNELDYNLYVLVGVVFFNSLLLLLILLRWNRSLNKRVDTKTKELQEMNKKLIDIDKVKTEFVSIASHQLRTPLSAIRWYIEELYNEELGKLNKIQKNYLGDMMETSNTIIRLVNNLLNISRLEESRLNITPKPTVLANLIKTVISEQLASNVKKGRKILFVEPKIKLPKIKIDPTLIRQVLSNLISNAVKYSFGKEKCKVIVTLKKNDTEAIIAIEDFGVGIPKKYQNRVFDKFVRAENVVKGETEGSGLGLYFCKKIIEVSGGKIWFKSQVNKGTKFFINLPLSGSKFHKGEKNLAV